MRTVQTLHDRQQKMATAELGHRDVFGVKLGPAGVAIQVFQVRSGRVVERVELGTEDAIVGSRDGEVLEAAIQQFYELRGAPPEIHVPAEPDERDALETWLSERAGATRDDRRAAARREARLGRSRQPQRRARVSRRGSTRRPAAQHDALETLQAVLALPALPRRIECFDISTIQGSETVASMVVCEDGRMRRASIGSSGSEAIGRRGSDWTRASRRLGRGSVSATAVGPRRQITTSLRCTKSCCAAIASCSSRADPFPDLVADRRRQGSADGGVRGARGARARESRRRRHREEGGAAVHARSRGSDRAARQTIRRCC